MKAQPTIARRIGVGMLAVCATVLTSCAAGEQAQTAYQTPAIDALAKANVGSLELRSVAVLTPPNGIAYAAGDDANLMLTVVNTGTTDDTLTSVTSPAAGGYTITATSGTGSPGASASGSATESASSSESSSSESASSSSSSSSGSASSSSSESASSSQSASSSGSASGSGSAGASGAQSIPVPAGQAVGFDTPTATNALVLTGLKAKLYPGTSISVTFTFAKAGAITVTVPVQVTENPTGSTIPVPSGASEG